MRIREIYIEGFGKLSKMKLTLSGGLNALKRENGFGKTTLSVFIKAMLYGLDKTKKQSISENDRKHYLPWSGGKCGGSLTLEAGGRVYRIERSFGARAQEDTFRLYDAETGKESRDYSERIGEELFGVDEDGFLRTVFLSEENLGGGDNKTVAAKLTSLVGCDGDISSLDRALSALEEERKIYYKRGGGGEIAELGRRIAELDVSIAEEDRLRAELRESESALREETRALAEARRARDEAREREAAGRERVRRIYLKEYAEMSRTLAEDEARLLELDAFFGGGAPSRSELWQTREKMNERALLSRRSEAGGEHGSAGCPVGEEDHARARELSERLTALDGELAALERDAEKGSLVSDLPSREEIENASLGLKKRGTLSPFLVISLILTVSAAVLGFLKILNTTGLIALGAVTVLMLSVGLWHTARGRRRARRGDAAARELIMRYTGREPSREELPAMLAELKRMSDSALAVREGARARNERLGVLRRERLALTEEAETLISRFGFVTEGSLQSRLNDIIIRRRAWLALSGERDSRERERLEAERRAAMLDGEIEAFLSRFKTESTRPLDEIASRLTEREALLRSLERTRESVLAFKAEHGISDADLAIPYTDSPITYPTATVADGEITLHESARALLERKCAELSAALSSISGVREEQAALIAKREAYERRLRIVTLTRELLTEASDRLTSRYLSGTKEAFSRYVSEINRALSGSFSMTTSFELMKSEGGEYRELEAYSRGTRDLYSLALRLALIDTLYENESPFIILDDPFAHLDDAALKGAKAVMRALARDRQIIYLTCSEARA